MNVVGGLLLLVAGVLLLVFGGDIARSRLRQYSLGGPELARPSLMMLGLGLIGLAIWAFSQ